MQGSVRLNIPITAGEIKSNITMVVQDLLDLLQWYGDSKLDGIGPVDNRPSTD